MLWLNNAGIEPGDILFVVGYKERGWLSRFKQLVQSIPTAQREHGHREVISVFVCTGENKAGKLFYNHEQHIKKSRRQKMAEFNAMSAEELKIILLELCQNDDHDLIKQVLPRYGEKGRTIAELMVNTLLPMDRYQIILEAINSQAIQLKRPSQSGFFRSLWQTIARHFRKNNPEPPTLEQSVLADFLGKCWGLSDKSQVLPAISHSLLVFKHNRPGQREAFLQKYQKQIEITEEYHSKNRKRTDFVKLFLAMFQSAKQDSNDKKHLEPTRDTYCARNIIEVLNQIDPNLVDRGRHVLPKELEAGMRAATKRKQNDSSDVPKDANGEIDWDALDKMEPPFTLMILPESGKELMYNLMDVILSEANRLSEKRNQTAKEKNKLSQIEAIIAPYRDMNHPAYRYTLHSQVEMALELLANLLPVLAIQTGFKNPLKSHSYRTVRAFARTQGIFDGDIREKAAALKAKNEVRQDHIVAESKVIVPLTGKTFLLTDWSFHGWSEEKQKTLLNHFKQLMDAGHVFYIWQNGQLLPMDSAALDAVLKPFRYFDVAEDLTPSTHQAIITQAKIQGLNQADISLLDYDHCEELTGRASNLEQVILKAGEFFSDHLMPQQISEKTSELIEIELKNTETNTRHWAELQALQTKKVTTPIIAPAYKSGVDTQANFRSRVLPVPLFSAIRKKDVPPFVSYERREVYTSLFLLENAESNHALFELQGNRADESTLIPSQFEFHSTKFDNEFIERLAQESSVYFRAKQRLFLTQYWQALPSCCAGEELAHLCIQGAHQDDFEIKKSPENLLYYIRKRSPSSVRDAVTVDYLLKMPLQYQSMPMLNIVSLWKTHQSIAEILLKYYGSHAGNDRLSTARQLTSGQNYLAEMRKLNTGSCRLRAIAFKEEMQREYPDIPVHIIVNDLHCYIEMKLDTIWQSYCLGGGNHFILQHFARPAVSSAASCQTLFSSRNRGITPEPHVDVHQSRNASPSIEYK